MKLLACITMLIDHLGAVFFPHMGLRAIGRLAFPIFCFLLAEGIYHTKNPIRYGIRLFVCMLLSEIPFDLLFRGNMNLSSQNVMVTLLLGFCMGQLMKQCTRYFSKVLVCIPFVLLGELTHCDYGGTGVLIITLFLLTRDLPNKMLLQTLGLFLLCFSMGGSKFMGIPIQLFATAAMVPIWLYSGRKVTSSKATQLAFYLFYPAHLAVLLLIKILMCK